MEVRTTTSLKAEDYPTERGWIGSLFASLNPFFSDVGRALNQNLTFGENIAAATTTLSFSYTGTASDFPKRMPYSYGVAPREVRVLSLTENGVRRIALINWTFSQQVLVTDLVLWDGTQFRKPLTGSACVLTLRAHP